MASEAAGSTAPRAGGGRGALLRDRGWARTRRSASLLGWTGGVGAHATSASLPCTKYDLKPRSGDLISPLMSAFSGLTENSDVCYDYARWA